MPMHATASVSDQIALIFQSMQQERIVLEVETSNKSQRNPASLAYRHSWLMIGECRVSEGVRVLYMQHMMWRR